MTGKLGRKHPIWYDSYCLCEFSRDKKRETLSVVMLKEMLKFFEIPFSRKTGGNLVANLSQMWLSAMNRFDKNQFGVQGVSGILTERTQMNRAVLFCMLRD